MSTPRTIPSLLLAFTCALAFGCEQKSTKPAPTPSGEKVGADAEKAGKAAGEAVKAGGEAAKSGAEAAKESAKGLPNED